LKAALFPFPFRLTAFLGKVPSLTWCVASKRTSQGNMLNIEGEEEEEEEKKKKGGKIIYWS
jgi:hypothetical protein